jgi:hypothetical protein
MQLAKPEPVTFLTAALIAMLTMGNACSAEETSTWKEEVLFQDGRKVLVTRTRTFGGIREVGQNPIAKWKLSFSLPDNKGRPITIEVPGGVHLMILDTDNTGSLVVAGSPRRGDAYNDYSCPNPPYVFFKYFNGRWERIDISAFPSNLVKPNLLGDTSEKHVRAPDKGYISAERIAAINDEMRSDEWANTVLRKPLDSVRGFGCVKKQGS